MSGLQEQLTHWSLVTTDQSADRAPGAAAHLVAFDLDDTLAPSKSPIDPRMATLLVDLLEQVQVCVISGGQFGQFRSQLLDNLPLDRPEALAGLHLMPTCGTQY